MEVRSLDKGKENLSSSLHTDNAVAFEPWRDGIKLILAVQWVQYGQLQEVGVMDPSDLRAD